MATAFVETEKFKRGESGELVVVNLLQERGWLTIPCFDLSGRSDDKAPKMRGKDGEEYVLPDIQAFKDGERRFIETKVKAAATFTRVTQRLEHGIDYRHYVDYLAVQRLTDTPVFLAIVEEDTGDVLVARLDELDKVKRVWNHHMIYFPRDAFSLLSNTRINVDA